MEMDLKIYKAKRGTKSIKDHLYFDDWLNDKAEFPDNVFGVRSFRGRVAKGDKVKNSYDLSIEGFEYIPEEDLNELRGASSFLIDVNDFLKEPEETIRRAIKKAETYGEGNIAIIFGDNEGKMEHSDEGEVLVGDAEVVHVLTGENKPPMSDKENWTKEEGSVKYAKEPPRTPEQIAADEVTAKIIEELEAGITQKNPGSISVRPEKSKLDDLFQSSVKSPLQKSRESLEQAAKHWKTLALDRYLPIKNLIGEQPYILHRMQGNADTVLSLFLRHGQLKWEDQALNSMEENNGLLPLMDEHLGKDSKNFFYWLAGERAKSLEKEGREKWLDSDARKIIDAEIYKG